MSALLKRAWLVSIDDLQTDALRVVFHVTKTLEKEPNTMVLQVYNLSDASRSKMTAKGMKVSLEAGYANEDLDTNTRSIIFSGQSRICDHKHETADWETKIQCGDGEQLYQVTRAVKSFSSGSLIQVIRYVADQLKVNKGNLEDAINNGGLPFDKFEHGIALNGSAIDAFNMLMRTAGYDWSVQQGALQLIKKGDQLTEEAIVLSKDTGLIGSPEHSNPHKTKKPSFLVAKSLLNPKIRPGCTVRMDSIQVKGDFIVHKVVHTGDSHGNDWTSHFEALASTKQTTTIG